MFSFFSTKIANFYELLEFIIIVFMAPLIINYLTSTGFHCNEFEFKTCLPLQCNLMLSGASKHCLNLTGFCLEQFNQS